MVETRHDARHRVLKVGTVDFDGCTIDCTVRNLSLTGAAINGGLCLVASLGARVTKLGHEVRLMPAEDVNPSRPFIFLNTKAP